MNPEPEERAAIERRLEPLVRRGFELYREQGFPTPSPETPPAPGVSDTEAFAAWYELSVTRDIEVGYRLSQPNAARLAELVAAGEIAGFTGEDAESAVELLNSVLDWALAIETETGGGAGAIDQLAAEFSGLSRDFLAEVMSLMEYYAR